MAVLEPSEALNKTVKGITVAMRGGSETRHTPSASAAVLLTARPVEKVTSTVTPGVARPQSAVLTTSRWRTIELATELASVSADADADKYAASAEARSTRGIIIGRKKVLLEGLGRRQRVTPHHLNLF